MSMVEVLDVKGLSAVVKVSGQAIYSAYENVGHSSLLQKYTFHLTTYSLYPFDI